MKERPKCQIKDCPNPAFVGWYGEFLCGDCIVKIMEKRKQKIKEEVFGNGI